MLTFWDCTPTPKVDRGVFCLFMFVSLAAQAMARSSLFGQRNHASANAPVQGTPCFPPGFNMDNAGNKKETQSDLHFFLEEAQVPSKERYAICDSRWHGLDITQLAVIASILAYEPPSAYLVNVTATFFPGWEVRVCEM